MRKIIILFAILILLLNGCTKPVNRKKMVPSLPVKKLLINWKNGNKKEAYKIFIDQKTNINKFNYKIFVKLGELSFGNFNRFKINKIVNLSKGSNKSYVVIVTIYMNNKITKKVEFYIAKKNKYFITGVVRHIEGKESAKIVVNNFLRLWKQGSTTGAYAFTTDRNKQKAYTYKEFLSVGKKELDDFDSHKIINIKRNPKIAKENYIVIVDLYKNKKLFRTEAFQLIEYKSIFFMIKNFKIVQQSSF